jgi:hypothetical protein
LGYDVYEIETESRSGFEEENRVLLSFLNGERLQEAEGYHPSEVAVRFFESPGLPPSLEHLTITDCHNLILYSLVELLRAAKKTPLKLKTIKVSTVKSLYTETSPASSEISVNKTISLINHYVISELIY